MKTIKALTADIRATDNVGSTRGPDFIAQVALVFEPRDIWVGAYWKRNTSQFTHTFEVFLTFVPMLPLHFLFVWSTKEARRRAAAYDREWKAKP